MAPSSLQNKHKISKEIKLIHNLSFFNKKEIKICRKTMITIRDNINNLIHRAIKNIIKVKIVIIIIIITTTKMM